MRAHNCTQVIVASTCVIVISGSDRPPYLLEELYVCTGLAKAPQFSRHYCLGTTYKRRRRCCVTRPASDSRTLTCEAHVETHFVFCEKSKPVYCQIFYMAMFYLSEWSLCLSCLVLAVATRRKSYKKVFFRNSQQP